MEASTGSLVSAGPGGRTLSEYRPAPTHGETAIRAAIALVPYLGGALEVIVGDAFARRHDRIRETAEETVAHAADPEALLDRLRTDEQLAGMFLDALDAAGRSHLDAKRQLLARVVARAADDDSRVDESALVVAALRELDAPHLRALERMRAAEDSVRADAEEEGRRQAREEGKTGDALERAVRSHTYAIVAAAVRDVSDAEPEPIRAALVRTGVTYPATLVGGGLQIYHLSGFGRRLLDDLRATGADLPAPDDR